jgi:periplasmic protein TonB
MQMRKSAMLFLAFCLSLNLFAQKPETNSGAKPVQKEAPQKDDDDLVICHVEREARFPGGDEAWKKYLMKHFKTDSVSNLMTAASNLPFDSTKSHIETAIVKFIVCKDGTLCDIEVENRDKVHPVFAGEAERLLKISPPWKPAEQNGLIVKAYRRQQITLIIKE